MRVVVVMVVLVIMVVLVVVVVIVVVVLLVVGLGRCVCPLPSALNCLHVALLCQPELIWWPPRVVWCSVVWCEAV